MQNFGYVSTVVWSLRINAFLKELIAIKKLLTSLKILTQCLKIAVQRRSKNLL